MACLYQKSYPSISLGDDRLVVHDCQLELAKRFKKAYPAEWRIVEKYKENKDMNYCIESLNTIIEEKEQSIEEMKERLEDYDRIKEENEQLQQKNNQLQSELTIQKLENALIILGITIHNLRNDVEKNKENKDKGMC